MYPLKKYITSYIVPLLVGLIILGMHGGIAAQQAQSPDAREQLQKLQAAVKIPDPQKRVAALDIFLKDYPNTPYKANVYRFQFLSYGEFSQDNDQLWHLGRNVLAEFTEVVDKMSDPYEKNPYLAHIYNEIAYEFADRGVFLDRSLNYVEQALALMDKAFKNPSPKVSEAQWNVGVQALRGQILDTMAWIQFKRKDYGKAEKAIMEAVELLPEHGTLHFHRGHIALAMNQPARATDAFLIAATVESANPEAHGELERLYQKKYRTKAAAKTKLDSDLKALYAKTEAKKIDQIVSNRLNTPAPEFTVTSMDGREVSLASLKGKVVVVNFWATWCPPCRKEMPDLEKVWNTYKSNEDVVFIIASVDKEQAKVKPYISNNKYTFPVYYGQSAAQVYRVSSIPTTMVIDKKGLIQYKHIGYRPDIVDVLGWQVDALKDEK